MTENENQDATVRLAVLRASREALARSAPSVARVDAMFIQFYGELNPDERSPEGEHSISASALARVSDAVHALLRVVGFVPALQPAELTLGTTAPAVNVWDLTFHSGDVDRAVATVPWWTGSIEVAAIRTADAIRLNVQAGVRPNAQELAGVIRIVVEARQLSAGPFELTSAHPSQLLEHDFGPDVEPNELRWTITAE